MISFKDAVKNGFKNAFNYSGRATRAEYWWFQLFMLLSTWGLMGLLMVICIIFRIHNEESIILWGSMIYWMIMIMPNLSLQIRRLHDTDHSGWNLLWCLVPLINYIAPFYILYLMCKKGSQEDNLYGPSPYETDKDRMNENSEDHQPGTLATKEMTIEKKNVVEFQAKESDHRRYMLGYVENEYTSKSTSENEEH